MSMKTSFPTKSKLEFRDSYNDSIIRITPSASKSFITVSTKNRFGFYHDLCFMQGKDLERFAVNILKALKSKKLK